MSAMTYEQCLTKSEKVAWRLDDELAADRRLDWSLPAVPPSLLLRVESFSAREQLVFSHVTANSYCHMIKLFEAFIALSLYPHVELFAPRSEQVARNRAILRVCDEEYKHQQMFERYNAIVARELGFAPALFELTERHFANPAIASAVAKVLVALVVEYLSLDQLKAVNKSGATIDPLFKQVLTLHAVEEAQHIPADELVITDLAAQLTQKQRDIAVRELIGLLAIYDTIIQKQDELDNATLARAFGRTLTDAEQATLALPHLSPRDFASCVSLRNPKLVRFVSTLSPLASDVLAKKAASYDRNAQHYHQAP